MPEQMPLTHKMTDLELIFTILGEKVTTAISQQKKPETRALSLNPGKGCQYPLMVIAIHSRKR
jgi:hypothetical protein